MSLKSGADETHKWHSWRALAGYVYLIICIFDFMIMPFAMHLSKLETKEALTVVFNTHGVKPVVEIMSNLRDQDWEPRTLVSGGLFHISFGAILTGVAVTQGTARKLTPKPDPDKTE